MPLVSNPFGQAKSKIEAPQRRTSRASSQAPDGITRQELEKHLSAINKGEAGDEKVAPKFEAYVNEGEAFHLSDSVVRAELTKYIKKQIESGDTESLKKHTGEQSIFGSYIDGKKFKSDSIESVLYQYVLKALKQKEAGKDPATEPVSLAGKDLESLIEHLTDKDFGLSVKAPKLDDLKKASDPMLRILYDVAVNKLGLRKAVDATKEQLLSGQSSDLTKGLETKLSELLKKEEAKMSQIFQNGDMIVSTSPVQRKLDKISIDTSKLGDDAQYFKDDNELNWEEFFKTAHKLAISGDETELASHVSSGLSTAITYFKTAYKAAEEGPNKEEMDRVNDQMKMLSDAIQGRGPIPERLAKIVREAATKAINSEDFKNRAAAGDVSSLSKELVVELIDKDLKSSELKALGHIQTLVQNDKIEIINPETFEVNSTGFKLQDWVENSNIQDSNSIRRNRELEAGTATSPTEISLERVKEAYGQTVSNACDKVFNSVAPTITGKDNLVSKAKLEEESQKTEENLSAAEITSNNDAIELLSHELTNYASSKIQTKEKTKFVESLKKYAEETLGRTGSKGKELWINKQGQPTELEKTVGKLATTLIKGASRDTITAAVTAFYTNLKTASGSEEDDFGTTLGENKGKERLRELLSKARVKLEDAEDLGKTLDLDKMMQIFDGSEGKKLQKAFEDLSFQSTKFSQFKDKPDAESYGEFATLLIAKNDQGSVDEAKRLTALVKLVKKAAGEDSEKLAALSAHVVSKLKGNSVKQNEETALAVRFKKAVNANVTLNNVGSDPVELAKLEDKVTQAEVDYDWTLNKQIPSDDEIAEAENKVALAQTDADKEKAQASLDILKSTKPSTKEEIQTAVDKLEIARGDLAKYKTRYTDSGSTISVSDFVSETILKAQQRYIVLRDAFTNARRELDKIRGHYSAVAMKRFGDHEKFSSDVKPATQEIINQLDTADKDSMECIDKVRSNLASNPTASTLFNQLIDGFMTRDFKSPKRSSQHPGDVLERLTNFLQSYVFSPVLGMIGLKANDSSKTNA